MNSKNSNRASLRISIPTVETAESLNTKTLDSYSNHDFEDTGIVVTFTVGHFSIFSRLFDNFRYYRYDITGIISLCPNLFKLAKFKLKTSMFKSQKYLLYDTP